MLNWRDLDLNQPLNGAHPLNRGRIAWWLTIPPFYGAPSWWDLVGGYPASFSGFAAGDGWQTSSHPGGAGSIKTSAGATECLNGPTLPSLALPSGTIALWVNFIGHTGTQGYMTKSTTAAASHAVFQFQSPLKLLLGSGSSSTSSLVSWTPTNGVWYHVAVTWNGTTTNYYLNGKQQGTGQAQSSFTYSNTANITVSGSGISGGATAINGNVNDVALWNRPLSAAEIFQAYTLSQQYYPDVLNWESSDVLRLLAPAAPLGVLIPNPLVYRPRFHPAYFE